MEIRGAKDPMIIAMKGLPCTGKSTLALSLAQLTRCPVIDQDSIRNCMATLREFMPAQHLDDLSFDAICRVIVRQQKSGLSLIIDSPLSYKTHLDRLSRISTSSGYSLVIVDCKPQDRFLWQLRLEKRGDTSGHWYKPSTWEDLMVLLDSYNGCPDFDTGNVSKIVVNTTGHVEILELSLAIQCLAANAANSSQPHSIDYHDFVDQLRKNLVVRQPEVVAMETQRLEQRQQYLPHLHVLEISNIEHNGGDNCRACLEPISGSTYECKQCGLLLHNLCAELPHKAQIKPQDFPSFLPAIPHQYSFPEFVGCKHHNKYYDSCHECLFESYIRCGLLPSVIHHPCHQHPLCVKIAPISDMLRSGFRCMACGDPGDHICYYCYQCGFECHLRCGLLPHTGKQEHHLHRLTVTYLPPKDDSEEFLCDACETYRNPNHWIYHCEKCEFASHLSCMDFANQQDPV